MARIKDHIKALELRKKGLTYSEIKSELGVSKSVLSYWLSGLELSSLEMSKLEKSVKKRKYLGIEKVRITKLRKREKRLNDTYEREKSELLPLNNHDIYLAGLLLYWGEGVKGINNCHVGLNNTDPQVVKFFLYWLKNCLDVSRERLKVILHLYSDMDIDKEKDYWINELKLDNSHFVKPYIKNTTLRGVVHKGYMHGTCGVYVYDARLKEKLMMGIKAVADYYSTRI